MGRIQIINYNHYEQEGSKLDALITVRGHNSTVFIGIRDGLFQCSQLEKAKRTFPAFSQSLEWAGPDTILQAEKSVVLVAGTPQISRSALERVWAVGERGDGGFNEATNVAMSLLPILLHSCCNPCHYQCADVCTASNPAPLRPLPLRPLPLRPLPL